MKKLTRRQMIIDVIVSSPEYLTATEIKTAVQTKYGVAVTDGEVSRTAPGRVRIMAACDAAAVLTARKLASGPLRNSDGGK